MECSPSMIQILAARAAEAKVVTEVFQNDRVAV